MDDSVKRFWSRVRKSSDLDGCWLWTGCRDSWGYGQLRVDGRHVKAHRLSWMIHRGPIPHGMFVLHDCPSGDNPACVNPSHLWLGDHPANMADMAMKGRAASGDEHGSRLYPKSRPRGRANGNARLTEEVVREIRRLRATGSTQTAIAGQLGVSISQVSKIVRRESWRHVEDDANSTAPA